MKKLFLALAAVALMVSACDNKSENAQTSTQVVDKRINPSKVYFFYYDACPFCHDALDYVNNKYPKLELTMVNISNKPGYDLFVKCANKFNLGRNIGTPLFCMGNKHLMGWSPHSEKDFDNYIKPFLK